MSKTMSILRTTILAAFGLTAGCSSETTTVVVDDERTGLLTVDWSILGTFDPGLCSFYGIDAMEIVVYDRFENFLLESEAPCEDFVTSIELFPDLYHADATLVGFADEAITVTEPLDNLEIFSDSELVVSVDYPAGSFL